MRINVIMPVYLGDYPGAAKNRSKKFSRAIQSFIDQDWPDRILILVFDGEPQDDIVEELRYDKEKVGQSDDQTRIYMNLIPKSELFSGEPRNAGLAIAKEISVPESITCYLDSDDLFLPGHLKNIAENFGGHDWVYFNDNLALNADFSKTTGRVALPVSGSIGTSNIAHRTSLNITWPDGYGHDWELINSMHNKYPNYKKITGGGYLVCHVPGGIDF